MAAVPIEFVLMLGYAIALALLALLLELAARHAHRRSLAVSTLGFTYDPARDIWRCPEDQHLFPVFADHARGTVIYRAPASACNACRSKPACTDSEKGREIERNIGDRVQHGMQRFHRAVSITLLTLACVILAIECFRVTGIYLRAASAGILLLFSGTVMRLARELADRGAGEWKQG